MLLHLNLMNHSINMHRHGLNIWHLLHKCNTVTEIMDKIFTTCGLLLQEIIKVDQQLNLGMTKSKTMTSIILFLVNKQDISHKLSGKIQKKLVLGLLPIAMDKIS